MSSDYHVLCMNHDPAIVVAEEWHRPADALAAVKDREQGGPLADHLHCDLLIGRYSAALVEVCCPGGNHTTGRKRMHVNEQWVDVDWLRLLFYAYTSGGQEIAAVREPLGDCWPWERMRRLRDALGIEVTR